MRALVTIAVTASLLASSGVLHASPASERVEAIRRALATGKLRQADLDRAALVALREAGSTAALQVIGDRRENQRLRLFLIGVPADVGHRAALASLERIADDVRESHAMRVAARSALHRLQDRLGIRRPGRVDGGVEWTRLRPELGPGCDAKLTRYLERKRSDVERCLAGPARGGLRESGELVIHGRFSAPRLTVLSVERDRQKLALPFLCVRRQFRQPATPSGGACTLRWRFPYKR